jgi:MFS family permease
MAPIPSVLRVPAFRQVWLASLASNAGSWLQVVAAGWLILELTGSPAAVGAIALVARAPALLLSTFGGQLADRFDRRAVGIATFAGQALAAGALAVLTWADLAGAAVIYVLTFVLGVGFALGLPAMLALIPTLVPPGQFSQAVSLNAAGINVARLIGPMIGGFTLATAGAGACFALNAVSFLALIAALWRLPHGRLEPPERAGMREALGYAYRDPAARRLLIGMAIFAGLAAPVQELAPVMAETLDAGEVGLGLLLGAMGGGALAGAWLLEWLSGRGYPRHHALPTATCLVAVFIGGVAVAPVLPVAMLCIATAGAFWIWLFSATNTAIQLGSPIHLRGRMLGLYQLSVIGPIALGSVAIGGLAEAVGIRWALGLSAMALAAWGAWSLVNRVPSIDPPRDGEGARPSPGLREGVTASAGRGRAPGG